MKMKTLVVGSSLAVLTLCGCQSTYYSALEKMGYHKRDILVTRVQDARDSQMKTKTVFTNALEQFRSVVAFKGGDLEAEYRKMSAALDHSESRARDVHDRIAAVENVADALFREWRSELSQYSSAELRRQSERELRETHDKYEQLLAAMKRAEAKLEPVLRPMRDQVLFLKHNLNAQAIGSLSQELTSVQTNVDALLRDMQSAIEESNRFIDAMKK